MDYLDFLYASDGTGEAVRAVVTGTRTSGATTLEIDSLNNWPTKFVATVGTLNESTGIIDPATVTVFKGHSSGGDIIIDQIAPGYVDDGNTVGQVVVLKPNTFWADSLANGLSVSLNSDGTLKSTAVDAIMSAVLDKVYPIGSIYTNSTDSSNPSTLLGFGNWVAFGEGRVPVGFDSTQSEFDSTEKTGGAKTHTLTIAQMPSHNHTMNSAGNHSHTMGRQVAYRTASTIGLTDSPYKTNDFTGANFSTSSAGSHTHSINNSGSGNAHNNLQPYIVVRMWKRTA